MRIINQKKINIFSYLEKKILSKEEKKNKNVDFKVKKIINDVQLKGDAALIYYTKKFDKYNVNKSDIKLSYSLRNSYKKKIDKKIISSFELAIKKITNFHKKQLPKNYMLDENGAKTGILWKPINSIGIYVPGGNANYPSTLLMNSIPAIVAGVKRIVVVSPSNKGTFNPYLLALLDILKIKEVYQIGGAQAIAALAYGTKTIPSVDKIFGPGNSFVVAAKKQVFGKVGIDLLAGPSEIIVVADKYNDPRWIASDLIAQAEHDEMSKCYLITNNQDFANKVKYYVNELSLNLAKRSIIKKSIQLNSLIIILNNIYSSYKIINKIAPEHLHIQTRFPKKIYEKITNAGCIFVGKYSPEALGDYIIGTNHVLPTSRSAKYSSGLGVIDYMKRTSFVNVNLRNFRKLSKHVEKMASTENLDAHKLSITIRQSEKK